MTEHYEEPVPLRAIAEKCGVSRTTVSRALRGDERVAKSTREKVNKAAKELGYHPDPKLEMLMTEIKRAQSRRYVGNLCVLWNNHKIGSSSKDNEFVTSLLRGALERAEDLGYALDVVNIDEPGMNAARLDKVLYNRGMLGVLIPPLLNEQQTIPELNWSKISVVSMTRLEQTKRFSSVQAYTSSDVIRMFEHIRKLGYRRPGLVIHRSLEARRNNQTIARYFHFCHEVLGIAPLPILEPHDDSEIEEWLAKHNPDLVIGPADWCYRALKENLKIKIPEDLGYIGFVDEPDCGASGIHQRPKEIGAAGIDLLTAHIIRGERGIPPFTKNVHIDSLLIEGDSLRQQDKAN